VGNRSDLVSWGCPVQESDGGFSEVGNGVHLTKTPGQRFLDPFQLLFVVRRAFNHA
jgi:hypothetical protein